MTGNVAAPAPAGARGQRDTGYRTIVADPPWPIRWVPGCGGRRRNKVALPYDTMSLEAIAALPVAALAADDAALFLWVPAKFNREGAGVAIARAWGFEPSSEIVWDKIGYGLGDFPRMGHELLLVCRRGRVKFATNGVHSVQRWPRAYNGNGGRIHSAKPDAALDLIERALPGDTWQPRLELFARRARFGWDYAGDQSLGHIDVDGLRSAR